jgi:UDP-glucose 4-epimerase
VAAVFDFARVVHDLESGGTAGSDLARTIGSKGYHAEVFAEGPYPVD